MTDPQTTNPDRNDIRYLIFLILLVFIVSMFTGGCAGATRPKNTDSRFSEPSCGEEPLDFRCKVYIPPSEIEYDSAAEEVSGEEF